jgi:MFS family permease
MAGPYTQIDRYLLSLLFALLLSTLETTIVATTLVNIASSFGQFDISGWIVVAYLLTYTGFLIVFARLSDFFGRKNALLVALAIFTTFSGICGAAQTMEQLYVYL